MKRNWVRRLFYPKRKNEREFSSMILEGVRVLPDLPKNMPHLETLIKEFETGFNSMSINRQDAADSSIAKGGNFVRKIVQAYESSARASPENTQYGQNRTKCGFSNALETIWNRKNTEKSDSRPATNGGSGGSPRCWKNLKEKLKISSAPFIVKTSGVENFAMSNRCHMESNEKTVLTTQLEAFSSSATSSSKKKKYQIFRNSSKSEDADKRKNKEWITCSSPLEDVEGKDKNCGDILEILTNSCDSNSTGNSSYKNLRVNLYDFEDERWRLSLSSASSISSRLSCDDTPSAMSHADYNLPLGSFFEDDTSVTSGNKDTTNDRENTRNAAKLIPSSGSNWKSPRVIGASLKRPIKIDDDTCVTWIPVLGEQLPRERSLKKLLSEFSAKLSLNYRKVGKKGRERPKKQEHTPDSGFVELFSSSLSSSSSGSWHSDPGHIDEDSSTSPTFRTFGRAKSTREYRANEKTEMNPRIVFTDVPREQFTGNRELNETSPWTLLNRASSPRGENRRNVDSLPRNGIIASSPKSKISRSSFPKHLHLNQSGISKYPSVAQTIDQIEEEEAMLVENLTRDMAVEQKFHVPKFEPPTTTPSCISVPASERALNISYPRMSEWLDSSLSSTGSRLYKSTSALDNVTLHRQVPVFDVSGRLSNLTAKSSSVIYCVPRIQRKRLRYATVSPKNLRFSMSREKSRAIEMCFDT